MLRGKGMWIWQADKCERGHVGAIVARAQRAGLSHVLVKIADGRSDYNPGRVGPLVEGLRAAGIEPWAWQYTYGSYPGEEARSASAIYREHDFAGFVVNAETEYKGHPARARTYMGALRAALPANTPVALSSFWACDYHPSFPWRAFLEQCDLGMPQVYWHTRDPVTTLRASLDQWGRYGVPLVPTGAAYPQAATVAGLEKFAAAVEALGGAVNYWDWQHCPAAMWDVIERSKTGDEGMATTRDVEKIARRICAEFAGGNRARLTIGRVTFNLSDVAMCSRFVRECCEAAAGTAEQGPLSARYFGGNARETEGKLKSRGTRIAEAQAVPGDIVCFNAGNAGTFGHIGLHLGGGQFAENTSSAGRGPGFVISTYAQIGRHRISGFYHLPEFERDAGSTVARLVVVLPGHQNTMEPLFHEDQHWVRVRDVAAAFGRELVDHRDTDEKLYITEEATQ